MHSLSDYQSLFDLYLRQPNVVKDQNALAIGGTATVWTPGTGKKIRFMGGAISVSAAVSILFEDNAGGSAYVFRTPKLLVDTPYIFQFPGDGKLLAAVNNVLKATSSAGANLTGVLFGTEESRRAGRAMTQSNV